MIVIECCSSCHSPVPSQIKQPSDLGFVPGDVIPVQYMGLDHVGRHDVSRKALLPTPADKVGLDIVFVAKALQYHSA